LTLELNYVKIRPLVHNEVNMKTYMAKKEDVKRESYLVDAQGKILGRLASRIAMILRGKHKPEYTPHVDCGDEVIIINAEKIRTTGKKLKTKEYQRYSGYPSGRRTKTLETMLKTEPTSVLRLAIKGMLPKGPLGTKMLKKLKVYAGTQHPHASAKPQELKI